MGERKIDAVTDLGGVVKVQQERINLDETLAAQRQARTESHRQIIYVHYMLEIVERDPR